MMSSKTRFLLASALSAATLLSLSACNDTSKDASKTPSATNPPATSGALGGGVAATVNGEKISEQRLNLLVKQRLAQGQPDGPEIRQAALDQLTLQMLLAQEAGKKGLEKSPEVQEQLEVTKYAIMANAFVQDHVKNNPVTDAALQGEYDRVKTQMGGSEYKAHHILVDQEDEAKAIIASLKKTPQAFESLAREKSKDPGSKAKGGDLGWFSPRGMVPEFGAAVEKLAKGKFTEQPVKSQFGYHVILLDDKREIEIPPFAEVKPMIVQQLQQQNIKKLIDDMKAKAKIEISAAPAATTPAAPAASTEKPAAAEKK